MKTGIDCERILSLLKSGCLDNLIGPPKAATIIPSKKPGGTAFQPSADARNGVPPIYEDNLKIPMHELDGATREQIKQHLEECPACRQIKENLEAISLLLRNMPKANPPENLWARIQADIRTERVPRIKLSENISAVRFRYFFAKRNTLALATAAVLVIAAIGFYLGSGRQDNGELVPSLSSLIDNDETREPNMNFESNIEKYFL